ncbi:hypothetical protein [Bradyrhizobium sp. 153]|uniref:hypothetical protein n=1 Tax=Bradyrhizobium sp. 153 TaxID=2782627 RepID=UPI001FF78C11|nr:hypothetical protein [Bradyrhizobium sp. 153]MCK1666161.1 hypothetical protein [Bradyrhizobium sp. 153]
MGTSVKASLFLAIAALVISVVWLGAAVVRLENYRYANFIGACSQFNIKDARERIDREACLDSAETRANWAWHLAYGLKIL